MKETYTYIEPDALTSWKNQMKQLNDEALNIIDSIEREVKLTTNYWDGNAAEGFTNKMNDLIKDGKGYHNKMKDIEKMITDIVLTAENQ